MSTTTHSKKSSKKTTKRAGKNDPELTSHVWATYYELDDKGNKVAVRKLVPTEPILRLTPFARSKYTPTGKRDKSEN